MSETDRWTQYVWPEQIVHAAPIIDVIEHGGTLSILIKPYDDDQVITFHPTNPDATIIAEPGGYALIFADGYRSLSPKQLFEMNYRKKAPKA